MCWWTVSPRARAWVLAHPGWFIDAPEGVECLADRVEPILHRALLCGLVVKVGEAELTYVDHSPS